MKNILCSLFVCTCFSGFGQTIKELHASEITQLDFGPGVQKEWATRDEALSQLSKGKEMDDLTDSQRAALEKYGEESESLWDIEGVGCSWYCGGGPREVTASSSLEGQGENNYGASNAHDLSYKTAWVEGVPGYGIGEYVEYTFAPESPRVNTIIVVNGYVKSIGAWRNNSRVKKLKMYVNDKPYAILNLKDLPAAHTFEIQAIGAADRENYEQLKKLPDWKLRFEILEVYKGEKYDDVAITEIYFSGLDVHCLGAGSKIMMADGSEKSVELLSVGDEVLSYNMNELWYETSTILELANPLHDNLMEITFSSGAKLVVTRDHPLFNSGGWFSYDPEKTMADYTYDAVSQLEAGMTFPHGQIIDIRPLGRMQQTYTIVKLSRNNIFIANGILVGTEELRAID